MAKLTKTQQRNMVESIETKTMKLLNAGLFSVSDFVKIRQMCAKYQTKLK
jgi:hypothetical protein